MKATINLYIQDYLNLINPLTCPSPKKGRDFTDESVWKTHVFYQTTAIQRLSRDKEQSDPIFQSSLAARPVTTVNVSKIIR